MQKLYEGKAKTIYAAPNADELIVYFKDSATAGNGVKKAEIQNKGVLNNTITDLIFEYLQKFGIKTHYIKKLSDREQLVKKVEIIPLEVIVRNISAGSFAKRYGVKEGIVFQFPTFEVSYKRDDLGDPLLAEDHAIALGIVNRREFEILRNESYKINTLLQTLFDKAGITLVDFKLEFGKLPSGQIILADEFSPDNSRLWDKATGKKLDKDNFRNDLGDLTSAYEIVLERLRNVLK